MANIYPSYFTVFHSSLGIERLTWTRADDLAVVNEKIGGELRYNRQLVSLAVFKRSFNQLAGDIKGNENEL